MAARTINSIIKRGLCKTKDGGFELHMDELVFAYIDSISNGAPIKQQKMTFSNEYTIELLRGSNDRIEKIIINPINNLYDNLYPEYIKNINLLVGINGSGKTSLFNILGSSRDKRKQNTDNWHFFFLYKVGNNKFVIEGNDWWVIREISEVKKFLLASKGNVSQEYSLVFEYDFENKQMFNIRICIPGEWADTKILYYQDLSTRVYQWSMDRNHDYEDYEIFIKRQKIRPSICALYEYINQILNRPFEERKGLLNIDEIEMRISFSDEFNYPWDKKTISNKDYGKNYLLATVVYLVKYCFYYANMKEATELVKQLEAAMDNNRFQYDEKWMEEVQQAIEKHFKENAIDEAIFLIDNLKEIISNKADCWFLGDNINWSRSSLETIFFRIQNKYVEGIANVLRAMDEINSQSTNFYNVKLDKLSAGETKAIDVFASISANIKENDNHYIVILDEPDKGLHPEMSREFIANLIKCAETINKRYNCTFQFVISSHSPFFVSDIPKQNVHCLNRIKDGVEITNSTMGLLSSIPDIMKNTFFLESPFGNVANQYFKRLQKDIMVLSADKESFERIDTLQKIIDLLEEPTVKMFLKQELDKKLYELGMENVEVKEKLIEYHLNEIQRLRGTTND